MQNEQNTQPSKEKPWTINSWDDLRRALEAMTPRTKLYEMIKRELQLRGNWKRAPRGPWTRKD